MVEKVNTEVSVADRAHLLGLIFMKGFKAVCKVKEHMGGVSFCLLSSLKREEYLRLLNSEKNTIPDMRKTEAFNILTKIVLEEKCGCPVCSAKRSSTTVAEYISMYGSLDFIKELEIFDVKCISDLTSSGLIYFKKVLRLKITEGFRIEQGLYVRNSVFVSDKDGSEVVIFSWRAEGVVFLDRKEGPPGKRMPLIDFRNAYTFKSEES